MVVHRSGWCVRAGAVLMEGGGYTPWRDGLRDM